MSDLHSLAPDPIEKLPAPGTVREKLSCTLRQVRLLRQLLRLAERAAKDREQTGMGKAGGTSR
jgi:hypothetical protein